MKTLIYSTLPILLVLFCCNSKSHPGACNTNYEQIKQNKEKDSILVGIIPIEFSDSSTIDLITHEIEKFYYVKTNILIGTSLPELAYYPPRQRYRADSLLHYLETIKPNIMNYLIGLTDRDISCTSGEHEDWGIFGYGTMPGPTCIVSGFRLTKNCTVNSEFFKQRIFKVVLHELGHNFGLDHCSTKGCLMKDAEGTIKTVDNERIWICDYCQIKLRKLFPE